MINKEMVERLNKKAVVKLCGYANIKALCKANPLMITNGKAPSRKQLIKELF